MEKEKIGIIKCGYKIDDILQEKIIKNDDIIFLEEGKTHTFFIDSTKDIYFKNVAPTNYDKFIESAKWVYINYGFLDDAISQPKNHEYDKWIISNDNIDNDFIQIYGIGKRYLQSSELVLRPKKSNKYLWEGNPYFVEVFNSKPGNGLSFYVTTYSEPRIRFAYFQFQEMEDEKKMFGECYNYGETIKVSISLHRFGKSNLDSEIMAKHCIIEGWLTDDRGNRLDKSAFIARPLNDLVKGDYQAYLNNDFDLEFEINTEWEEKYHETNTQLKKYSLELVIKHNPPGVFTSYKTYEYNIAKDLQNIIGYNNEGDLIKYKIQNCFVVSNSPEQILQKIELATHTQIAYVGDVNFKFKENDPCSYTSIKVQDLDNPNRPILTIFNEEDSKVIDNTEDLTFDILAGDIEGKPATIKIIAENYQTSDDKCQQILLGEGEKHTENSYVFNVNKIYSAYKAFEIEKEEIVKQDNTYRDDKYKHHNPFYKEKDNNYKNQNVEYKADGTDDYDLVAVGNRTKGASIFNWIEGKHYEFDEEISNGKTSKSITLKNLHYVYNKKDKFLQNWRFNYFFLNQKLAKTIFVPVSSCRYPNQIAKIRIFPDIKWSVYVVLEPIEQIYKKSKETNKSSSETEDIQTSEKVFPDEMTTDINGNRSRRNIINEQEKKVGSSLKEITFLDIFKLKIFVESTINDEKVKLGANIQNALVDIISVISLIKKGIENLTFKNIADKLQETGKKSGKFKPGISTPLYSLNVSYPSVRIGGEWKYNFESNQVKCYGALQFGFEPLISAKGSLDLIQLAQGIPAVKAVMKALKFAEVAGKWVAEKTSGLEIDIYANLAFNIYLRGAVNFRNTYDFYKNETIPKFDIPFLLGVEIVFKVKATVEKIIYMADTLGDKKEIQKEVGFEGNLSAGVESRFNGNSDKNANGETVIKIDFTGVAIKVIGNISYKGRNKDREEALNFEKILIKSKTIYEKPVKLF